MDDSVIHISGLVDDIDRHILRNGSDVDLIAVLLYIIYIRQIALHRGEVDGSRERRTLSQRGNIGICDLLVVLKLVINYYAVCCFYIRGAFTLVCICLKPEAIQPKKGNKREGLGLCCALFSRRDRFFSGSGALLSGVGRRSTLLSGCRLFSGRSGFFGRRRLLGRCCRLLGSRRLSGCGRLLGFLGGVMDNNTAGIQHRKGERVLFSRGDGHKRHVGNHLHGELIGVNGFPVNRSKAAAHNGLPILVQQICDHGIAQGQRIVARADNVGPNAIAHPDLPLEAACGAFAEQCFNCNGDFLRQPYIRDLLVVAVYVQPSILCRCRKPRDKPENHHGAEEQGK